MRTFILAVVALGTFATPVLAHPEHDEPYRAEQRKPVPELAQEAVVKLVTQAKLPSSWSKARAIKSTVRTKNGSQQWVILFQNKAEPRASRRLLYVLMTPAGEFISANHRLS